MRLFHCIRSLNLGGEQTYLIRILNNLGNGYEHTVAYAYCELLKDQIHQKVNCMKYSNQRLKASHPETYWLFFKFLNIFSKKHFDCVLLYSPGSIESFA